MFGQQSSVDELLDLIYVLRRLFMYGCCLGRTRAVMVVVLDLYSCLRCVSCFLFDEMLCLLCSVTGNVGQQSSGDELLNLMLL